MENEPAPALGVLDDPVRPPLLPIVAAVVLGVAVLVGLVVLWPRGPLGAEIPGVGGISEAFEGRVVSVQSAPCEGSIEEPPLICIDAEIELLAGPDRGDVIPLSFPRRGSESILQAGEAVLLGFQPDAPQPQFRYTYLDRQRQPALVWLAALFALAVVLLGRLRGLAALVGLAASFGLLLKFVLPSIIVGHDPLLVAVVGAAAIAYLALYLAHGFTVMTTVALLGTLGALGVTALLGSIFVGLAKFSGLGSEEAFLVQLGAARIDLVGLLLAGVIIGALGAIDDMSVTQASAVWELRRANPHMTKRTLFHSGLRIGRDHVASTVNTLVLAYAGASMPILILLILAAQPVGLVVNTEAMAGEIVRTLVGSVGLVACVPLTTWLAARFVPGDEWRPRRQLAILRRGRGRHRAHA